MNEPFVNTIFKLFERIQGADHVVLCTLVDPADKNRFTVWAINTGEGWCNVPGGAVATIFDLGNLERGAGYYEQTHVVTVGGFTYRILHNLDAQPPLNRVQAAARLADLAHKHKPSFYVPPQAEIDAVLARLRGPKQICFEFTIDFKQRIYTLQMIRPYGEQNLAYEIPLDPPAFDSALRERGYYMADPPTHLGGNLYAALCVRGETAARRLITDATDRQANHARNEWMTQRAERQFALAA